MPNSNVMPNATENSNANNSTKDDENNSEIVTNVINRIKWTKEKLNEKERSLTEEIKKHPDRGYFARKNPLSSYNEALEKYKKAIQNIKKIKANVEWYGSQLLKEAKAYARGNYTGRVDVEPYIFQESEVFGFLISDLRKAGIPEEDLVPPKKDLDPPSGGKMIRKSHRKRKRSQQKQRNTKRRNTKQRRNTRKNKTRSRR